MDIVSWRWMRVVTAEPRSWAIWESALFLAWASSCRCSTGCSETRIRNIQKRLKRLDFFAASLYRTPELCYCLDCYSTLSWSDFGRHDRAVPMQPESIPMFLNVTTLPPHPPAV